MSNSMFSLTVLILGFWSSDVKIRNSDVTNNANFVLWVIEVAGPFRIRNIHFKSKQNIDTTERFHYLGLSSHVLDNSAKAKR